jgi:hypothetical protein
VCSPCLLWLVAILGLCQPYPCPVGRLGLPDRLPIPRPLASLPLATPLSTLAINLSPEQSTLIMASQLIPVVIHLHWAHLPLSTVHMHKRTVFVHIFETSSKPKVPCLSTLGVPLNSFPTHPPIRVCRLTPRVSVSPRLVRVIRLTARVWGFCLRSPPSACAQQWSLKGRPDLDQREVLARLLCGLAMEIPEVSTHLPITRDKRRPKPTCIVRFTSSAASALSPFYPLAFPSPSFVSRLSVATFAFLLVWFPVLPSSLRCLCAVLCLCWLHCLRARPFPSTTLRHRW